MSSISSKSGRWSSLLARMFGSAPKRPTFKQPTRRLHAEQLEDRTVPTNLFGGAWPFQAPSTSVPNAAGHWEGTLRQPGGPSENYAISLDLTQSGSSLKGTRTVRIAGATQYFGVLEVAGSVLGNNAYVTDQRVVSQNLQPGYRWLLATLSFPVPAAVPSATVNGTWWSGFWSGTIQLRHTSGPGSQPSDLKIETVSWLPLDQRSPGHLGQSAVTVSWNSNAPMPTEFCIRQSSHSRWMPNTFPFTMKSPVSIKATELAGNTATLYFTALPVLGNVTDALQIQVTYPAADLGQFSRCATVDLYVKDSRSLSYELDSTAPIAATREDRVQLWLEEYGSEIHAVAGLRKIDPAAIAGAIAWEAIENAHFPKLVLGPGKVHPATWFGDSDVVLVERLGYLPQRSLASRYFALLNPDTAIQYIGAIMGAYADQAESVGYNIRNRPEILATYYNGAGVNLQTVAAKLRAKFPAPLLPGPTMGQWVADHLAFLRRAVGTA